MSSATPTVLAIDTATEVCSVAVLHGDQVSELVETVGNKHSECALPMIDAALEVAGLTLGDIEVFAFGAGPGSFTGLRIGCGITQGLAYGKRKRIVPVGNLRALAARAFAMTDDGDVLLAAIDARMNEAYCAVYRRDASISELRAPALERPPSLVQLAATENVQVIAGNALTAFASVFAAASVQCQPWIALPAVIATASTIAQLARVDAARGWAVAPADAVPIYVRDQVALTIAERQQAGAPPGRPRESDVPLGGTARSARGQHP